MRDKIPFDELRDERFIASLEGAGSRDFTYVTPALFLLKINDDVLLKEGLAWKRVNSEVIKELRSRGFVLQAGHERRAKTYIEGSGTSSEPCVRLLMELLDSVGISRKCCFLFLKFSTEAGKAPALVEQWRKHAEGAVTSVPPWCRETWDADRTNALAPFSEGRENKVVARRRERSRQARDACLKHWGHNCCVCEQNFEEMYGPAGLKVIEVHHLNPLSGSKDERIVDPVNDLRPVCANCHSVIHSESPSLTIKKVRTRLEKS